MAVAVLMRILVPMALSASLAPPVRAAEEGASVEHGRALVEANCSPCHATGMTGDSPHPQAPPFRTLAARYPVEMLEEALGEGIMTGHPDMPEFIAEPGQIDDIIAYLKTLTP